MYASNLVGRKYKRRSWVQQAQAQAETIPHICHFFTQAKILENKIYTEKRVNYDKLHSKLQIFRVKSVKNYIGQFFYTDTVCGVCDK